MEAQNETLGRGIGRENRRAQAESYRREQIYHTVHLTAGSMSFDVYWDLLTSAFLIALCNAPYITIGTQKSNRWRLSELPSHYTCRKT
jgi:hypothetical protein